MRHLFVPACACLMTISGAVSSDRNAPRDHFMAPQMAKAEIVSLGDANPAVVKVAEAEPVTIPTTEEPVIGSAMKVSVAVPATEGSPSAEVKAPSAPGAPQNASDATPDVPDKMADATPDVPELAIEYPAPGVLRADVELPQAPPLPLRRPPPRPVVHRTPEEICQSVTDAAEKNRLPAPFFIRLLFQESRFKPGAVSPAGALGIAQFMPETSASMGVDNPFDPLQAIPASARLLRELFEQFGNLGLAAAAYNAGPERIQDWLHKGKKLPQETKGYVHTITGRPAVTWKNAGAAEHGEQRLPRLAPCQKAAGLYAWNGPEHVPLPIASPARAVAEVADKAPTKQASVKVAEKAATDKATTKTAAKKSSTKSKSARRRDAVQLAARERHHRHRHRHRQRARERQSRLAER